MPRREAAFNEDVQRSPRRPCWPAPINRHPPDDGLVEAEIADFDGFWQCQLLDTGAVLSIAGLWDQWKDPEAGEAVLSCTLIVTAANDFMRRIHDRMPVLLGHHDSDAWLTEKNGIELLRPAPNDFLRMWPVSKRVNVLGRGDDDPSLIEPVKDAAIAGG